MAEVVLLELLGSVKALVVRPVRYSFALNVIFPHIFISPRVKC